MKRNIILFVIVLLFIFSISYIEASNKYINTSNINTLNIEKNLSNKEKKNIKKLCYKEYCDYLRSTNFKDALNIFVNNYLKDVKDDEIKSIIRVKGLNITKIEYW